MNSICNLLRRPIIINTTVRILVNQERYAGHSKWQNIRHTKGANDQRKSIMTNKHCFAIRRAIYWGGGQTDPKINGKLADAIALALKANVPKDTINRTLEKAKNVKMHKELLEVGGPGGCFMLVDVETDNISRTRHDLKKIFRKVKTSVVGFMREGAAKHAFNERGVIRLKKKVEESGDLSFERMEEIAIEIGAEEVAEDSEEPETVWTLFTAPLDVMTVKGQLEKALPGVEVVDADTRYLPVLEVPLSDKDMETAAELLDTLQELDEVNRVFDNIA